MNECVTVFIHNFAQVKRNEYKLLPYIMNDARVRLCVGLLCFVCFVWLIVCNKTFLL